MCKNCGQNMGNDSKAGTLAFVAKFALLGHFIICTWLLYCVEPKAKSTKWGQTHLNFDTSATLILYKVGA